MIRLKYIVFLMVCCFQVSAFAQNAATEFRKQMEAKKDSFKSLEATFTQKRVLEILEDVQKTEGRFYFVNPDKLRWETAGTEKSVLILDGKKVTLRKNGVAVKQKGAVMQATIMNKFILGTVNGTLFDDKSFKTSISKENNEFFIVLEPLTKMLKKRIARIELKFNDVSMFLNSLKMVDKEGDYTLIEFKDQKKNSVSDLSLFQ